MDRFFTELGQTVLSRWKQTNFSLAEFPKIASRALTERPPAENVDLAALIREFLLSDNQAPQSSSGFGQPELIVYDDPRFYIQVLFWLEGTTQIHQHEFSGAFHVMEGTSIHSEFTFENAKSITAHFRVGDLQMKGIQLLETGQTVPIVSGRSHIHSLFHLDTPSLTVVIRTHSDPGTGPQFTYLPPHLAVDPFYTDSLTSRRTQLLDVLERLEDPSYPELIREMIADLDFERGFFILQNGLGHLRNLDEWTQTWKVFRQKHGKLANYVAPTLDEIVWRDGVVGLRSSVTEVEHRFFLALLLNAPSRTHLLKLVGQRFAGSPVQTVLRWAEELSETSDFGTLILDAGFPFSLKIAPEDQLEIFLSALGHFLNGKKTAFKMGSRSFSAAEENRFRNAFAASSLRALVA